MTRDTYDKATVALDRTLALKGIRDKIKRELPELEHDKRLKEWVGDHIFEMLELRILTSQSEFEKL